MPDLQSGIDRVSKAFADALREGKFRIADSLARAIEGGATADEVLAELRALTVDDLLRQSGLGADLTELERQYSATVLRGMTQFAAVSEDVLASLVEADSARWLQFVRGEVAELVTALQRAILTGGDSAALRAVAKIGLTPAQAEALVNTSLNTFSRTVTAIQAQAAPEETLYGYDGPVDGRTRDLCLKMSAAGELTYAEVERAFPGAFRDGGGFNCRHQWLPVGTTSRRFAGKAVDAIAARGTGWKEPLTVQQQLEARQ